MNEHLAVIAGEIIATATAEVGCNDLDYPDKRRHLALRVHQHCLHLTDTDLFQQGHWPHAEACATAMHY